MAELGQISTYVKNVFCTVKNMLKTLMQGLHKLTGGPGLSLARWLRGPFEPYQIQILVPKG